MIINVTGVRREESSARAKGSIATLESDGKAYSWRPMSDWTTADVFARIEVSGLAAHEAYTRYGLSRVSCRFCIMSSRPDLMAAAAAPESHEIYRHLVSLEARSTFGFQGQPLACRRCSSAASSVAAGGSGLCKTESGSANRA
jgi:3'-phosphoadenosine 5'-phosphosulfate sulfotransferase (PAPS reductase)/FAD synthetase